METFTSVKTDYSHYVFVGEAKLDLRQTIRELDSVIGGYPAAMQLQSTVVALKSLDVVRDSTEHPGRSSRYMLVPGPAAAGFLADLKDAFARAQVREEQLTQIVQEAVAEYAPVSQVAVAGPKF